VSWRAIARKDVRDAGRSRTGWLLFAALSLLFVGYAFAHGSTGETSFTGFLDGLASSVVTAVPIAAIFLGYRSVCDDRTSGSLFLTLSFPHSRRDLVVGTFVGRTVVLLVPTMTALSVAGVIGAARYGTDGAMLYPWFLLGTAVYGAAFVGFAVGLSVSTTRDRQITYGAVGGYLLLAVWSELVSFWVAFLHRFDPEVGTPDWALFLRLTEPGEAYSRLLRAGFDVGRADQYLGSDAPVYVEWWVALALLVCWTLVPLVLGFRRFQTADL